jgi:phage terminase large subunit-like protein
MALTQAEEIELLRLFAEEELYQARNRLEGYRPYPKQLAFHAAGSTHRERLLMASNRFGKTVSGAAETAIHLTGRYPDWWTGKRFDGPVRAWAAGVTNESTRDVVQEKLMGPPERRAEWGTGMIPYDCIDLNEISTGRGLADQIDTVPVRHASGGWSRVQFKSFERGREKWQGTAQELIWMDEEPPMDVYLEALTRTNETGGIMMVTFTPLLGYSGVVLRFLGNDEEQAIAA